MMRRRNVEAILLALFLQNPLAASFLATSTSVFPGTWQPGSFSSSGVAMATQSEVPTVEELSKDPFMKQVGHAGSLVELLQESGSEASAAGSVDPDQLEKLLVSQLSHSDGIRGFFVTYLTGETSPADQPTVPVPLRKAMEQVDPTELVPLACMNVIMPTAMVSMHQDPSLSEQSKLTAQRGTKILAALKDIPLVPENCEAILAVATGASSSNCEGIDSKLVEYWTDFFEKWGYKEPQKEDIAAAMKEILS